MALENRLELKLSQKLMLTPQLQLAIKLLQMPQMELSEALSQELVENPFLEEVSEEKENLTAEEIENTEPVETYDDTESSLETLMSTHSGMSVEEYFDERGSDGRDLGYFTPGTVEYQQYEQAANRDTDIYDHLLWQLRLSDAPQDIREIGEVIIGNIDENGYLQASDEDIAETAKADIGLVGKAVSLIQSFDPCGIAARNIQECLLIQLKALNPAGSLAENIVLNNMADLEKKRYQQIARQHNLSLDDIMAAVNIIQSLKPKPAGNFSASGTSYVVPDVFIIREEDGYQIVLNDETLPRLRLNNQYRKLLASKNILSREEKNFLIERLRSAVWLLKSLDQRHRTIYKTTECILNFQRDFFDKGVSCLKPLNLRNIAQELNLHESTISRATSNKYLSCSHGIFSFKFFFCSSLNSAEGSVSSTSVKDLIKQLVAEEDATKPLSDQRIAEFLTAKNITIARRTVAKYRDESGIPAQGDRRKIHV